MERHVDLRVRIFLAEGMMALPGPTSLLDGVKNSSIKMPSLPIFPWPFFPDHPPFFLSLDPQFSFSYHRAPQDDNLIIFGSEQGDPGRSPALTPPLIRRKGGGKDSWVHSGWIAFECLHFLIDR